MSKLTGGKKIYINRHKYPRAGGLPTIRAHLERPVRLLKTSDQTKGENMAKEMFVDMIQQLTYEDILNNYHGIHTQYQAICLGFEEINTYEKNNNNRKEKKLSNRSLKSVLDGSFRGDGDRDLVESIA